MSPISDALAASSIADEEPVVLNDRDMVEAALTAERDLLDNLVVAAEGARDGSSGPVALFIERYWVEPLRQDREAVATWLADLQDGDVDAIREAASEELHLSRFLRRMASGLAGDFPGRSTLQAAMTSYDYDFRTEAEGKRSILDAL